MRTEEYLQALQAQDSSPAESENESTVESKLKLEDVEEIVDRTQTVNADVQFVTADIIIYAGDGFEDRIDED